MNFIIPQNYNFKNKILGIIDYSTAIFNIIWYIITFSIINLFFNNWNIIIFLFISFSFPITIFSIVGFNGEPLTYVVKYLFNFLISPKVYLFQKIL